MTGNPARNNTKARLKRERATYLENPKKIPGRLTIAEIEAEPALFQPRFHAGAEARSEAHVGTLLKALSYPGADDLGVMTVWWSGKRWVLVDGHHRMEAQRRHSASTRGIKAGGVAGITVPVICLTGPLQEAIEASLRGNSHDKLAMSQEEKIEGAWQLVCDDGEGSAAHIAAVSGASPRTVKTMRRVRSALLSEGDMKAAIIAGLSWTDARRRANGEPQRPDYEDAAVLEARAQEMATRLSNTFEDTMTKAPEVAARALAIHSPQLVMSMVEEWLGSIPGMADHVRAILADQEQDGGLGGDDGGCGDF